MIIRRFFIGVCVSLVSVPLAHAHAQDQLDSLDVALDEVTDASVTSLQLKIQELEGKILELETAVRALQEERASADGNSDAALRDENARLRKSVQLLYGGRVENLPRVPIPNRDLLEEVLEDVQLRVQYEKKMDELTLKPSERATPFEVIKEWGRSPEAVAKLNGNYSTLKGMAIFVAAGTSRENMEAYARKLREQFEGYDNLNIEVFDRRDASEAFAAKGTINMGFRVMSISKHAKSELDVVLVGRGRSMEEVR